MPHNMYGYWASKARGSGEVDLTTPVYPPMFWDAVGSITGQSTVLGHTLWKGKTLDDGTVTYTQLEWAFNDYAPLIYLPVAHQNLTQYCDPDFNYIPAPPYLTIRTEQHWVQFGIFTPGENSKVVYSLEEIPDLEHAVIFGNAPGAQYEFLNQVFNEWVRKVDRSIVISSTGRSTAKMNGKYCAQRGTTTPGGTIPGAWEPDNLMTTMGSNFGLLGAGTGATDQKFNHQVMLVSDVPNIRFFLYNTCMSIKFPVGKLLSFYPRLSGFKNGDTAYRNYNLSGFTTTPNYYGAYVIENNPALTDTFWYTRDNAFVMWFKIYMKLRG